MKTYRVLAEYSELLEIFVEADSQEEAMEKAREAGESDFTPFDPRSDDNFTIIENSAEVYAD